MSRSEEIWTGYLAATVARPKYLALFLGPAVIGLILANVLGTITFVQGLFIFWGLWHVGDVIVLWIAPVEVGVRLWFPPHYPNPPPEVMGLVRFFMAFDVLFGAIRFLYALYPTNGPLAVIVVLTALIQGGCMSVECAKGTTDWRAATIAWGGAVILLVCLALQLAGDGVTF